jgi:hypothetical protein
MDYGAHSYSKLKLFFSQRNSNTGANGIVKIQKTDFYLLFLVLTTPTE